MTDESRKTEAFLKYLAGIEPSAHISSRRRGSEENVKMKFTVPLLEYLGFDRIKDMDFEMNGMDVGVSTNGKLALVVECKAWGELLTNHLDQCLEYTLTSSVPSIFITSGLASALYSSLLSCSNLLETQPIIKFGFGDLKRKDGGKILERLHALIGKESLLRGGQELQKEVGDRLVKGRSIEESYQEFTAACSAFEKESKTYQITNEDFQAKTEGHPPQLRKALMRLRDEIRRIDAANENVETRYRTREIGIEYIDNVGPRPKKRGLFGVYPGDAHVAFGVDNWERLHVSTETLRAMEKLSRRVKGEEDAERIIQLLGKALDEVEKRRAS
jgi:hypothetical protein